MFIAAERIFDGYDAILSKDDSGREKLLVVVADVAGKSVPAALLMATFQATTEAYVMRRQRPRQAIDLARK